MLYEFDGQRPVVSKDTYVSEIARVIGACLEHSRPVYIELPRDMVAAPCAPVPPLPAIQVDADAAAIADRCDLICFFCLSDRCFGSADLFFIRENIQVVLTDFQLDLFSRLQECFLCCFDRGIRFLH